MDTEAIDRFLPGNQLTRSTSALTHRDLEKNTFLKLPPRERNLVSGIKTTLEQSIARDFRYGVLNLPTPGPSPRLQSAKTMLPISWPPEGYRSVGIHDRVQSSHGRFSGNITDAKLCTCDRPFRSDRKNLLSIQFCDILGPYACSDCTRKRKFARLHDAVIPPEMDENAFTPLARMEREAAMHQKKLLDRRREIASAGPRVRAVTFDTTKQEEAKDTVPELPSSIPTAEALQKRRGTVDMLRSLVKFTRYASSFSSYEGNPENVRPPLARTGAFKADTG